MSVWCACVPRRGSSLALLASDCALSDAYTSTNLIKAVISTKVKPNSLSKSNRDIMVNSHSNIIILLSTRDHYW